jgi:DMSO/TMAO reductase YedYZ heme-binding membrane subunit
VASTRSRPRGREHARPSTGGVAAEHATKIYTVAIVGIVVIVAFLALTSIGHVIDAATQHFMLFYAGVFALIALCASVGLGLVSTDRMFLHPGNRVLIQSAHRAASFGALAFLIIHVITEILAQRVHVLDAFVPFLSPFRTFYIGLGTIASDLIILLAITGIMRGRFNASGKAWRWRAIHYTSYAAFVFGVWHGLLGGRPGKPYVDWSYGFVVAFVLLGLAVRVLSNSLRPKENLSAPPVDMAANSASAPLRAAAMLAQYGTSRGGRTGMLGAGTGSQPVMSAPLGAPVLTALPAGSEQTNPGLPYYEPGYEAPSNQGQPYYEPGYEGPPRYLGAPRNMDTSPMPQAATGPMPRAATGQLPRAATGPLPRPATGPMPRTTGSMPAVTASMPSSATGAMPRANSGPMPRPGSGATPRGATGPMPRTNSGPYPAQSAGSNSGAYPAQPARSNSGAYPAQSAGSNSGSYPAAPAGSNSGAYPAQPARSNSGPYPTAPAGSNSGPYPATPARPQSQTGSMPRVPTGPQQPNGRRSAGPVDGGTGPRSRPSPGALSGGAGSGGPGPRGGSGPQPRPLMTGPVATGTNPYQQPATGPYQQSASGPLDRQAWPNAGSDGSRYPEEPLFPETDPNLKYREPGPGMPGYRGSREHRYGGDRFQ